LGTYIKNIFFKVSISETETEMIYKWNKPGVDANETKKTKQKKKEKDRER
jgi:hypothetical protein